MTASPRRTAWLALALLCACGDDVEPRDRVDAAGSHEPDAAIVRPDAHFEFDAPSLDAAFDDAPFAFPDAWAGMDAWMGIDAAMRSDAAMRLDAYAGTDAFWGRCSSGGMSGLCMPMSMCAGMSIRGLCPGPADIQCCISASDGGMIDAFRPPGTVTPADVIARLGACARIGGDYARDSGGTANIPVCQTDDVIWWAADMDIDCDGGRGAICMDDPTYLPDTSAVDSMGRPLDASTLPFIVIPLASTRFRYTDHGIRHGQVGLVLYRDRMVFGIFGDLGPASIIGEASFAMAEALGIPSSPRTGGVDSGVTYLIFTGTTSRVTRNEDHAEAVRMGEVLLDSFMTP